MDISQEIAKQVQQLPPAIQEQVLRFVSSLAAATPAGQPGPEFHQFAGLLDSISAHEMREAIENDCEQIEPGNW
jgi:hypothetical protein